MVQDTNSITRALMLREAVCKAMNVSKNYVSKAMNEGRQLSAAQTNLLGLCLHAMFLTYSHSRKQCPYWLFILHLSSSYPPIKLLTHS